jgi:enhancing lycopene biosynthesis protein 2
MARKLHAAVILAGCGHMDGSEIREAVLTLLALDQDGATFQCIAPSLQQHHVMNHATGKADQSRNRDVLEESSRISRSGQCLDLAKANPVDYDVLLLPGGLGVAKNLCDFAMKGAQAEVHEGVSAFVRAFLDSGKPIGAICIAPALMALVMAKTGRKAKLTLGSGEGVSGAISALGQTHVTTASARDIMIDESLKLVTTGAYMFESPRLSDVFIGIERCVSEVLRMA